MSFRTRRAALSMLAAAAMMSNLTYAYGAVTATQPGTGSTAATYMSSDLTGYVDSGPGTVGVFAKDAEDTVTVIDGTGSAASETVPSAGQEGTSTQPGGSVQQGPGVQQEQQGPGVTGSQQQTSQISIDQSIAQPQVASEAAVLYDATTGQFLFDKNGTKAMYPASTTKLMTALLAVENLSLDDTVTYTATATQNLESGAATVNLTTGDQLSVRDSLYAMLLKSACEVANGLGEKVSGSQAAFAERMNQRAQELGCTGTHFENASGLNGASHYTTARDMALIANAAVSNETVRTILQTRTYQLPASKNRGAITVTNGNKMINQSNSQYYEGILGGKTGYTSKAGNTLAEVADVEGHRLVAVVMKSKSKHYDDVKLLFDYGKELIRASAGQNGSQTAPGTVTDTTGQGSAAPITPGMTQGPGAAGSTGSQSGAQPGGTGPQSTAQTGSGFVRTEAGTQYVKADGSICKNEWLDLEGKSYFFDGDGLMCTGWIHFANGDWYYFDTESGEMIRNKWVTDSEEGKSYYLTSSGVMARNTVIDGTYRVNENGEYVEKVG